MGIGESIKRIRKEKGMTLQELANNMGCTPQLISQYETKKRIPKLETIQKIAHALDVPLHDIFVIKEDNGLTNIDLTDIDDSGDINKYLSAIIPHFEDDVLKEKSEKERVERLIELENLENQNIENLVDNYLKLNPSGQQEALKRVEELTEIPRYTKKEY